MTGPIIKNQMHHLGNERRNEAKWGFSLIQSYWEQKLSGELPNYADSQPPPLDILIQEVLGKAQKFLASTLSWSAESSSIPN